MGKVVTTKKNIEDVEERKRTLINILLDLEKANVGLNLYTNRPKVRTPLLQHEKPIIILMSVGALYEALGKFNSIKGISRELIMENGDVLVKESMEFLCGKTIENFKSSILNDIRNKGAFHADSEIVCSYLKNYDITDDEELLIWQENEDGSNNYPIANDILAFWFLEVLNNSDILENVIYMGTIYNNLRKVVHFLLMKWFKAKIITN